MSSTNDLFLSLMNTRYGEEPPPPEFTPEQQEKINSLLAKEKKEWQAKLEAATKEGNPAELKKKLKEMQDTFLTKEQIALQETERQKTEWESTLKTHVERGDRYEGLYHKMIVETSVANGATKHNAFDASQLLLLVGPGTQVVETTDADGKGTGQFRSMTKIKDKDGKELVLPTEEAIGKLREFGQFPNQFRIEGQSGTGSTLNNQPPGAGDKKFGGADAATVKDFATWYRTKRN